MTEFFNYNLAFSRNLGWVTEHEQAILRTKRVAIAGLGGVGGSHLQTLTRLGIGAFHIADYDFFELVNFNRQIGAVVSQLERPKAQVLAELALDINPDLEIRSFPKGVAKENAVEFLDGVDLYVDGLDFFAIAARREIFAACRKQQVPAITAAPLGMGVALLNFLPGGMSFETYFRLSGQAEHEQLLRFLLGLSPAMLQMKYLVDPSRVDLPNHQGPSTVMGCELCAGVAATEALKILLRRGKVVTAPLGLHFDAYRNRLAKTWRPFGNNNPIQRLALAIARPKFSREIARPVTQRSVSDSRTVVERILDVARWAPSGDNVQPWRFEIASSDQVIVHARDQAGDDVYDFNDGQASWTSFGCLLETLRVAATRYQREMSWSYEGSKGHTNYFKVVFEKRDERIPDPLFSTLLSRSVDRRPYRFRRLSSSQRKKLEAVVGPDFVLYWSETLIDRLRWARINALATDIRLRIPEAYAVHRHILDWDRAYSPQGIPVGAIGIDSATRRLMRWAMRDWARVHFLNRFLGGTMMPRLEFDWLPGVRCAAHFFMATKDPSDTPPDRILILRAGMAFQRLWLTAHQLGLALHPSFAPLAFSSYARNNVAFTEMAGVSRKAETLERAFRDAVAPVNVEHVLLLARIGVPSRRVVPARSIRRPLEELVFDSSGRRPREATQRNSH